MEHLREFNRTRDDPCDIQERNNANSKKLKFITTNHRDLIEAKNELNFFGIGMKHHLFVPEKKIDEYSQIRLGKTGNIMTNINIKNDFGQLPVPTMPYRGQLSRGDVKIEDSIRNNLQTNRKTCNPKDAEYFKRSFAIFDDNIGIETPSPVKSVEPKEFGPRGGIPSRFDRHIN
jgi:hypothetical protein